MAAFFLATSFLLAGCSGGDTPEAREKADISRIKSALKRGETVSEIPYRIFLLREAYESAAQLESKWPDSEKVPAFLKEYRVLLDRVPDKVYALSRQSRDFDSFLWAIDHSVKIDTQHSELLAFWKMGKQWRDYFVSEYPEKSLSIFMSEAVDDYSIRFFNQYAEAFKASGYRLEFPLEKTEFNARYCHFIADMIEQSMKKGDEERIGFLIDNMPPYGSVVYIDLYTVKTMQALGDYVCHDLKNEVLACKLVGLGYDMGRIDLARTGFGTDFVQALENHPEHAVLRVLKLNEWRGALSAEETGFLLALTDPYLRIVHPLHIDEAIETSVKKANTEDAVRLIELREELKPLTPHDYGQLLGWSLEYNNRAVFDYVKKRSDKLDIFTLDLSQLAESQTLFRLYAPTILKKIYRTMDREPKSDGTTFGRIHDLLINNNPDAVLYIVENHDFGNAWTAATDGRTLLMDVCEGGNLKAAKYLVEKKGADVHAHTGYIEMQTSIFGRSESAEGRLTPLFFAAKSGNGELIEYLAAKGADVNARSGYGATPLMHAVDAGHLEAVKTLIALGAKVNAAMNSSLTPKELGDAGLGRYDEISNAYRRARKNDDQEMLDLLKRAGARP